MSRRNPGSTLTDKEKMFCKEYIIDLNATNAAIRAGYSEDSAATTGYHVKQRPEVEAYIEQLMEERSLRLRINADDVLLELAKIAFAKVVDVLGDDTEEEAERQANEGIVANNLPKKELSEVDKKTMEYFRQQRIANKPSAGKCTPSSTCRVVYTDQFSSRVTTIQFSITAKIAALKLLAKHLGLLDKQDENTEDYKGGVTVLVPEWNGPLPGMETRAGVTV